MELTDVWESSVGFDVRLGLRNGGVIDPRSSAIDDHDPWIPEELLKSHPSLFGKMGDLKLSAVAGVANVTSHGAVFCSQVLVEGNPTNGSCCIA